MCKVIIHYSDGQVKEFSNINTISYFASDFKSISGDQLLTSPIPITKNIYLLSSTSNITISCTNVSAIEIQKL